MVLRLIVVAAATTAALTGFVATQQAPAPAIRPSQHGSVSQHVNATTITIEYNRPVARGREFSARWCRGAGSGVQAPTRAPASSSRRM